MPAPLYLVGLMLCISVFAVDFDFEIKQNTKLMNTDDFRGMDNSTLIVRRAQEFRITCVASTCSNTISFILNPIDIYSQSRIGTPIIIKVVSSCSGANSYCASTVSSNRYSIFVPLSASVGAYSFSYVTGNSQNQVNTDAKLVIIFNTWSKVDPVYLSDRSKVDEYVLNEDTIMFLSVNNYGLGWSYSQFDYRILKVTISFLYSSRANSIRLDRSDVIQVSHYLSSVLTNINQGGGLLAGRWFEPYTGGTKPWDWVSSLDIFAEYDRTKSAVKFGQCWVFSGVLVSSARSLGIPSRQITNINSAHESKQSSPPPNRFRNQIDLLSDDNISFNEQYGGSIWNFHSWTEFWINGEWAAVDATPQESFNGVYQVGPAKLSDIRSKNLAADYQVDFVASETNARTCNYVNYNNGGTPHPNKRGYWLVGCRTDIVGYPTYTKAAGSQRREEVSQSYKWKNTLRSDKNKVARHLHLEHHPQAHLGDNKDVTFELESPDTITMGESLAFKINVVCNNCTRDSGRVVRLTSNMTMIKNFDGDVIQLLNYRPHNQLLELNYKNNTGSFDFIIPTQTYEKYLANDNELQVYIIGKVYENRVFNGNRYSLTKRYEFVKPEIEFEVTSVSNSSFKLTVSFFNPLSIPLSGVSLVVSGTYLELTLIDIETVNPKSTYKITNLEVDIDSNLGWPNKGWILAMIKVFSNEISRMDAYTKVTRP